MSDPLINLLKNVAGNFILEMYNQLRDTDALAPELAEIEAVTALRQKHGAVILLVGAREGGNTTEGLRIAEIIGRPVFGLFPEQRPPSFIGGGTIPVQSVQIEDIPDIKKIPPFSTLFCDDLSVYASNRDYYDKAVQNIERLIPVVRHRRKLILIFRAQTSGQVDRHMLDADIVSLKATNPLFLESERGSVARIYKKLDPVFKQMTEIQQKKHAWLITKNWEGMVRVQLPNTSLTTGY